MADLRTDYKDDILDLTQNTQRKYRMITNDDGTVSFEDVTVYSQIGDIFGAADVNTITNALNNTEGSVRVSDDKAWIQLWSGEEWINWKSSGLVDFNVLDTLLANWTTVSSYLTNPIFELTDTRLIIGSQKSGTTYGTGEIIKRTEFRDFSKYNVLRMTGVHHCYMWNNQTAYGYINLVDINGNKTNLYTKSFGGQIGEVDYDLPTSIDVSDYDGEYCVEFYITDKTSNQCFDITNMVFSAD